MRAWEDAFVSGAGNPAVKTCEAPETPKKATIWGDITEELKQTPLDNSI